MGLPAVVGPQQSALGNSFVGSRPEIIRGGDGLGRVGLRTLKVAYCADKAIYVR